MNRMYDFKTILDKLVTCQNSGAATICLMLKIGWRKDLLLQTFN